MTLTRIVFFAPSITKSGRPVYEASPSAEGDFEEKVAMLLVWANVLNRSVPAFTEAQRLVEGEDSLLGRVIRSAKNRKTTDIAPGTKFGRSKQMYRIVLACSGIPAHAGPAGARDISEEFTHRPWHKNLSCKWDGSLLILQADNDFDSNGLALMDEFSEAISACIKDSGDGSIDVVSVTVLAVRQRK